MLKWINLKQIISNQNNTNISLLSALNILKIEYEFQRIWKKERNKFKKL